MRAATALLIAALVFGFARYVRAHPITVVITPDDFAWWEAELASTTT